ncbi:DUF6745 domain-containing protein [Nocardia sp. NPDC050710]|uniref:DUF6745 domain-containing protein n=1 Tax=Nocardia sp. NPDC050710 TaxID=3157220 RepID=UPI00340DC51E
MSTNRAAASRNSFPGSTSPLSDTVASGFALRDEWLRHGLCTEPSDRSTAEAAVTELYRLIDTPEPEFVWVPSPPAAVAAATELGVQSEAWSPRADVALPVAGRIATLLSASRHRMDCRIDRSVAAWANAGERGLPPQESAGRIRPRPDRYVRTAIQDALRTTLIDGVATAVHTLIPDNTRATLGIPWYGQQEAHRIGYYDVVRRNTPTAFRSDDDTLLDTQAALARSTGWWWSFDHVCIMAERPTSLHTEPTPAGRHNELRLHHFDLPAIGFADRSGVYVQRGTIVPDWVVLDPSADRIGRERNAEIRRTTIERIGWDTYIDDAELVLIGEADDPGNPGSTLRLYDPPAGWGRRSRPLLAENGSVEPDGHRRRYGLHVPIWIDDPLAAAGWTYGLSGTDYDRLVRRT